MTRYDNPRRRAEQMPSESSSHSANEQSATILIVDDDPTARLTLAAILAREDYRIVFAADAAEVRERLARIDPDVIVCDLVMEDMSGDEFFRWLQAHDRWHLVPIIGVTALDNQIVRADLLRAGADCVLVKPCNGQELRAHVHAALRTRRKYQQLAARGAVDVVDVELTELR